MVLQFAVEPDEHLPVRPTVTDHKIAMDDGPVRTPPRSRPWRQTSASASRSQRRGARSADQVDRVPKTTPSATEKRCHSTESQRKTPAKRGLFQDVAGEDATLDSDMDMPEVEFAATGPIVADGNPECINSGDAWQPGVLIISVPAADDGDPALLRLKDRHTNGDWDAVRVQEISGQRSRVVDAPKHAQGPGFVVRAPKLRPEKWKETK